MLKKTEIMIIMCVYNGYKFLSQTISSLKNQSFKNFFILFVDDGSTDRSPEILKKTCFEDDRFFYVPLKTNCGPGFARNFGLDYCKKNFLSKYLIFLDCDDYYDSSYLMAIYNRMANSNADICVCNSINFDETKIYSKKNLKTSLLNGVELNPKDICNNLFLFCVGWTWDKIYKTNFILNKNLRFQQLRNTDDAYFVFCSLFLAKKISILEDTLIYHRVSCKNSVSNNRNLNPECLFVAIEGIKNKLLEEEQFEIYKCAFFNWTINFIGWYVFTLTKISALKYGFKKSKQWINKNITFKVNKNFFIFKKDFYKYFIFKHFNFYAFLLVRKILIIKNHFLTRK